MNTFSKAAAVLLCCSAIAASCTPKSKMIDTAESLPESVETEADFEQPAAALHEDDVDAVDQTAVEVPDGFDETPSPSKEMIADLAQLGIFENMNADFDLLEPITRGEYLALVYYSNNAIRETDQHLRLSPTHEPGFTDIDESHPAYKYVQAFTMTGHSVGYQDSTFKPDQALTREEMVAIKVQVDDYSGKPIYGRADFGDSDKISADFIDYVERDRGLKGEKGTNISRAFGNIKVLKPQESVLGYEAAASVWEYRLHGGGFPTNAAKALKDRESD